MRMDILFRRHLERHRKHLEKISDISTASMQLVEGIQGIKGEDGKTPQMMINTDGHLIAIYED